MPYFRWRQLPLRPRHATPLPALRAADFAAAPLIFSFSPPPPSFRHAFSQLFAITGHYFRRQRHYFRFSIRHFAIFAFMFSPLPDAITADFATIFHYAIFAIFDAFSPLIFFDAFAATYAR